MNLILSGVLAPLPPLLGAFELGGLRWCFGCAIVVMRWAFVVSAEGGGGSEARLGRPGRT